MVLLVLVRLVFFVFKVQFLDYPFLFYFFFRSMENAQRQKEYREWKKLHDSNFLQKKLTRQKYYKPTNTLTKTQLKERREAVKQKVHDSVDQSRETVMTLLSWIFKTVGRLPVSIGVHISWGGSSPPPSFLRHPPLGPACPSFLNLFPVPSFLFHPF